MFHCNRTHTTLLVPVSVWFQFSRNILILLPISTCYNQHVLKIKMLHPPKQIRFHPCITPLPRHKGHLSKIATLLCWGRSRGVRDITTCCLGLRMPQIPFPRTSILKMFQGGGRILLNQPTRGLPLVACTAVFQTLFSKILYGPQLCTACKVNHPMHVP